MDTAINRQVKRCRHIYKHHLDYFKAQYIIYDISDSTYFFLKQKLLIFFRLGAERFMGSSDELQECVVRGGAKLLVDGSLDVR